jgi:hypothetical protein
MDADDDFIGCGPRIVQRAEFKFSGRTVGDELNGLHAVRLNKTRRDAEKKANREFPFALSANVLA